VLTRGCACTGRRGGRGGWRVQERQSKRGQEALRRLREEKEAAALRRKELKKKLAVWSPLCTFGRCR